MSLLNRPSDGLHSVLTVLFRLVLVEDSIPRDRLLAFCSPKDVIDQKQVRQTLNRWIELGLFHEDANGDIRLHAEVQKHERDPMRLRDLARRLVLREDNNADLWAAEGARAADFTRSISWMLAQDVYSTEFAGWTEAQKLIQRQIPDEFVLLQNDTRWGGLKAWATFLGFGWTAAGIFAPDPTDAIRAALPDIFGKKRELEAATCVAALAESLPILDRGRYRVEVEGALRQKTGPYAWRPPSDGQLSTSLSRALLRLNEEGTLTGRLEADFDTKRRIRLTGREGKELSAYTFSHLTFNPAP